MVMVKKISCLIDLDLEINACRGFRNRKVGFNEGERSRTLSKMSVNSGFSQSSRSSLRPLVSNALR